MYKTYFLKFSTQQEAENKLTEVGYKHEDTFNEKTITYYAMKDQVGDIDIIGDIYNNDAVYDTDENGSIIIVTPPTKKQGYHVNIVLDTAIGSLPEALQIYCVEPLNPYRVFA